MEVLGGKAVSCERGIPVHKDAKECPCARVSCVYARVGSGVLSVFRGRFGGMSRIQAKVRGYFLYAGLAFGVKPQTRGLGEETKS